MNELKAPPLKDEAWERDWKKRQKRVAKADRQREVEVARGEAEAAKEAFLQSLIDARRYFRKSAMDRRSFAEVRYNARYLLGEPAVSLLDHIYDAVGLAEPKTAALAKVASAASLKEQPYSLLAACCKAAETMIEKQRAYAAVSLPRRKEAAQAPFAAAPGRRGSVLTGLSVEKVAAGLFASTMEGYAKSLAGEMLEHEPTSKLRADPSYLVNRPSQKLDMRRIQAETMLADFLANDDILSGHDPSEVAVAFNELAKLAPRAALQPSIMRPLLRKYVTGGGLEPFELRELSALDLDLKKSSLPPAAAKVD